MTAASGQNIGVEPSLRARVRASDPDAFAELFDKHAPAVYRCASGLTGNWSAAEEVVSLTFLEAWRLRQTVTRDGGSLRPWLLGIAVNVIRNQARAARRHQAAMSRVNAREKADDVHLGRHGLEATEVFGQIGVGLLQRLLHLRNRLALLDLVILDRLQGLASSSVVAAVLVLPTVAAAIWTMVAVLGLIHIWPIGIRIDSAGIRIGGLRAWERRQLSGRWPPRKPFHVGAQGRAVFTCPWEGVRELYLIGSQAELKPLLQQKRASASAPASCAPRWVSWELSRPGW